MERLVTVHVQNGIASFIKSSLNFRVLHTSKILMLIRLINKNTFVFYFKMLTNLKKANLIFYIHKKFKLMYILF